ncbi:MAG: FecR domain-containing protein [Spirosomataceae bacterium]
MKQDITKELIFSHFSHKTSPLQRKMIDEWLTLESNEEQFFEWLEEFENKHPQYLPKSEAALIHYENFLVNNPHGEIHDKLNQNNETISIARSSLAYWLVAASVVLFLGIWSFRNQVLYQTYQTGFGETKAVILSDGSQVTLNANSSLRLPRFGFGNSTREVFLKGEANFSVIHTQNHQKFIVKTNKFFEVEVLGTEFTVFARQQISKVVLNKGKVQVRYQQGHDIKQITMRPGDLVSLNSQNKLEKKVVSQPQNYAAWEQKRFVFEETTLQEVAYLMHRKLRLRSQNRQSRVI